MSASIYCGIPIKGWLHRQCVMGLLQLPSAFPQAYAVDTAEGFLPRARDQLTARFLNSSATHFLCVDSDVGWSAMHVKMLLDADKDVISGIYCKKEQGKALPFRFTGETESEGAVVGCDWAPGGFLLIKRAVIERMVGAYRHLHYLAPTGEAWGLWLEEFKTGCYDGEDVAFCKRWTALGGKIWAHRGVILNHYGEAQFTPHVDANGLAALVT